MKKYAAILWLLTVLAVLPACGAQTLPAGEDDFAPAGTAAQAAGRWSMSPRGCRLTPWCTTMSS